MNTLYKLDRDTNGNTTLRVKIGNARAFSIQTNGNLPTTHRDGIGSHTQPEVDAYMAEHRKPRARRIYINLKGEQGTETVDEFTTRQEARAMLKEYAQLSGGEYYISSRACKDWNA